jgi:hypothetical protein
MNYLRGLGPKLELSKNIGGGGSGISLFNNDLNGVSEIATYTVSCCQSVNKHYSSLLNS